MARRHVVTGVIVAGSMAVGGVAGAVLGVPALSGASTPTSTAKAPADAPPPGHLGVKGGDFEAAAKALNLTTDQLKEKLSDGTTTIADVAKQQNVDINTVIDAIAGADRQRIENFVNNPLPKPGKDGPGPFGRGGFGMPALDAVAKALNIDAATLKSDLKNGKTIKQIAQDQKVDLNTLIDTLVADATKAVDDAKNAGKITDDMATNIKSHLKDGITAFVNGDRPARPGPGMGGFGGPGGGHFGRRGAAPSTTAPAA